MKRSNRTRVPPPIPAPSSYITTVTKDVTETIISKGVSRDFIVRLPAMLQAGAGMVFAFHGGGGKNSMFKKGIGLDAEADSAKFIAVYPQSLGTNWTDGRNSTAGGPDDVQFFIDMIDYIAAKYKANASKVFIMGISNGGLLCHWLAHKATSRVTALMTVAANIPTSYSASFTASKPIIMVQGLNDAFMLFGGGTNPALGDGTDSMESTLNSIGKYKTNNGAGNAVITAMPDVDPADGCTTNKRDYPNGTYQTTAYIVDGGGHAWPGGTGTPPPGQVATKDFSATALGVAMFKVYGL